MLASTKQNKNLKFIENFPGQAIPPGLHVRINLQTGKKEAKLLDANEKVTTDEKSSAIVVSPVTMNDDTTPQEDDSKSTHSRLKDALKNIPDEGFKYSEDELKEITKKFRSYDTIKQEFEEMDMNIKSDFELMSDLFAKYEQIKDKNDLHAFRSLFEDLEYLLHQIDNANDFVTAGGLEKLIMPNLGNQSIPELRIHSVKLLGVLVQNNPKAQIAAFEKNVGSLLLRMLSQSNNNNNGNSSTSELSSLIFAIGGLLRKFPLAQDELLNSPGLKILVDLLGNQVDYKIKIKCLLLITDLIRDYDEVTGDLIKTQQYDDAVDIRSRLLKTEYCTNLLELFNAHRQDYLESLYVTEDILNVLIASKELCEAQWIDSSIFPHTLLVIRSNFDRMKNDEKLEDFDLMNTMVDRLDQLEKYFTNHTVVKDEL